MITDPIYLFDGSAYIFRAFYATPRLTNSDGMPTNALFGFTRMVMKFLHDTNPAHVLMVFDAGKETFRNELYPEYKANRDECPEDLVVQMPHFRTISRALGFPVVELPGFEADDLIGTLAVALQSQDYPVVIISADKDLMQLVNGKVSMWDTMRDKRYDPAGVKEKLGVLPEQVIDFLALAGDSSDNIPGLKGAGPKTAVQLIERYGSVEKILDAADEIREDKNIRSRKKIAERIEDSRDIVLLSKQLVTIKTDVPVEFAEVSFLANSKEDHDEDVAFKHLDGVQNADHLLSLLHYNGPQMEALTEVAKEFSFHSLLETFDLPTKNAEANHPTLPQDYKLILRENFDEWVTEFRQQEIFSFDLETTSLDVHEAKVVGFACCWDTEKSYYIPCGHEERGGEQVSFGELRDAVQERLQNPLIKKIGQNLKYDSEVFLTHGVTTRGVWFDTMVAAYLLHPDVRGYGLSNLAKRYLSHTMIEYTSVVEEGGLFSAVSLEDAVAYAAEDAHIAWLLYEKLAPLVEEAKLQQVCYEIESPLVEVLSRIEHWGIHLDCKLLEIMSQEVGEKLQELRKAIYEAAGSEFNINSPKQIGEVLFEKLGISTHGVKKTKTGFSTNQAVLEKLRDVHPVPALIVEYRGLHKLQSTYLDSLPKEVSPLTGKLHTRLNPTIAAPGRLSSSEPNLQNIPSQTELGRQVRKAFIPSDGKIFLAADYSQIELRLLAHLSGDEALIDAFQRGIDIHERTAREVLGKGEFDSISSEERRLGKTMNFGIVYGMSGFRLSRELGIPVGDGNAYIERYFARYPRVQEYFHRLEEEMEETDEVRTICGRRRVMSEIDQGVRDKNFVKRAALNAPLQGSAADLIKLAMLRMDAVIREKELPLRILLQVHDELLFEGDSSDIESLIEIVKDEMEGVMKLAVPLRVDVASGNNWEEAHSH